MAPPALNRRPGGPSSANGCLVTPGLVNTHHHIYQNLTRSFTPAVGSGLFEWLRVLYPHWALLDEEAVYLSTFVGLAELALGGCTTTTDHLYVHPAGAGDLLAAEIAAAREVGLRFHPTRGSMSVSEKDGGLPPDSVCEDEDTILAASEAAVSAHHDRSHGAMVRVALAPCSPFTVSRQLMSATAELAERLDVRLHTHLAEDPDEDTYCLERYGCRPVQFFDDVGWLTERSWVAHCVHPDASEVERLGRARGGGGPLPQLQPSPRRRHGPRCRAACGRRPGRPRLRRFVVGRLSLPVARGPDRPATGPVPLRGDVDGRTPGPRAGHAGGSGCLGRQGELGVLRPGAVGDLVCWRLDGPMFAGALTDPVEALLRCGPARAYHTVVAGQLVVEDGVVVNPALEDRLARHRCAAARIQGLDL